MKITKKYNKKTKLYLVDVNVYNFNYLYYGDDKERAETMYNMAKQVKEVFELGLKKAYEENGQKLSYEEVIEVLRKWNRKKD